MKQDMIVILDLGSSENTTLAREIRALGVYSEIYPHDITKAELQKLPNVKGVILNGGEHRNVDGKDIDVLPEIYEAGYPVIAIGMAVRGSVKNVCFHCLQGRGKLEYEEFCGRSGGTDSRTGEGSQSAACIVRRRGQLCSGSIAVKGNR